MASTARIDELKKKFDENPRRYFAPLANEFRKAGDIEQAIVICEEFLPQQPGHMSGHIVYGQALYEAGRLPESRAVFETALGLDPENLIALRHLGDIAHSQGDDAAARSWYLRVLDADPRNEEIQALIATLAVVEPPAPEAAPMPELTDDHEAPAAETLVTSAQTAEAPAAVHLDLALDDTHPFGMPSIPAAPAPPPIPAAQDLSDSFGDIETQAETSSLVPGNTPPHGLESTAFVAPTEQIHEMADLDDSLVTGVPEFEAPPAPVAALDGLEGSGGAPHEDRAQEPDYGMPLELDSGFTTSPQGDAIAPAASSPHPTPAAAADALPEFDVPEQTPPAEAEATVPMELPPAVIAAEAELTDEVHDEWAPAQTSEPEPEPAPEPELEPHAAHPAPPFVTETMAELYLTQGFRDEARSVYEQLLAANPSDERLQGLVASLAAAPAVVDSGPNVRDFFARLAARRPGTRAAAEEPPGHDDFAAPADAYEAPPEEIAPEVVEDTFASFEEVDVASEEVSASPADVAPAIERAARMRTPAGSIDAFFGNRPAATSEDSAAAALAQAFGGNIEEEPVIAGRPAHAATGELSLDSVFRDGPARPPRTSQSFSFDQFFAGDASAGADRTSGQTHRVSGEVSIQDSAPAERNADDIEQFNSWLQGLKPR